MTPWLQFVAAAIGGVLGNVLAVWLFRYLDRRWAERRFRERRREARPS